MTELSTTAWIDRLTEEQRRFYYLHQLHPENPELNVTWKIKIKGSLDRSLIQRALQRLVDQQPMLRVVFSISDQLPVIRLRAKLEAEVTHIDLSAQEDSEQEARLRTSIDHETCGSPFSLEDGPLFKLIHYQLAESSHVLLLRVHHLICENACMQLLIRGLLANYEDLLLNRTTATPSGPLFDAYIEWETARNAPGPAEARRAYWHRKLASRPVANLKHSEEGTSHSGKTRTATTLRKKFSTELTASLLGACETRRMSEYAFFLATFQILLHKLSGLHDIFVGVPISARADQENFSKIIGMCTRWGVLREKVDPALSFDDYLIRAKQDLKEVKNHSDSVGKIAAASRTHDRTRDAEPLFLEVLNFVRIPEIAPIEGLQIETETVTYQSIHFDLLLKIEHRHPPGAQNSGAFEILMTYTNDAYTPELAQSVLDGFQESLAYFLKNGATKICDFQLQGAKPRPQASETPLQNRLAIASTFTAEPIEQSLNYWLTKVKLTSEIRFEPVNQVFQGLLNPSSGFYGPESGANVILLRFEDWKEPEKHLHEFIALLEDASPGSKREFVVAICPPSPHWQEDANLAATHERLEAATFGALQEHSQIHLISSAEVSARYPVAERDDPESDHFAIAPYTSDYYHALATTLARKTHSILRPGPKVLVLDCDNTLWKGVIGEDGMDGIRIEAGHLALQKFAQAQAEAGVLLCLSSKNNEADVWEVFDKHPDMRLRREQIVAHRINWEPKSRNIAAMAKELNLGIDSFAFFDDSRVECAEVSANCPAVQVLRVPERSDEFPHFLNHLWLFDQRKVTDTDRRRTDLYRQNAKRERLKKDTGDLEKFIASLEVKMSYQELTEEIIPRVSQMTQRTNQFNFTTLRRSESEIRALSQEPGVGFLIVEVTDRFGDYGIVGLVIYRKTEQALVVDTFLLSCRALGRGVEQQLVSRLGKIAEEHGLREVQLPFIASAKNTPASQFLTGSFQDFCFTDEPGGKKIYRLPAAVAAGANFRPMELEFVEEKAKETVNISPTAVHHAIWMEIATHLREVSQISAAVHSSLLHSRPATVGEYLAPRDPVEIAIALIWQEVLCVERVGVRDPYFSLGGDSIRSLQIALKLRKQGYAISPLDLHQLPTVEALANELILRKPSLPSEAKTEDEAKGPFPLGMNQSFIVDCYSRENCTAGRTPSGAYHVQNVIPFQEKSEQTSLPAVISALHSLFASHPSTRSFVYSEEGKRYQAEGPVLAPEIAVMDLSGLSTEEQDVRIAELMRIDRSVPFHPFASSESPFRVQILIRGPSAFDLFVSAHHGFCDGWGLQEFYGDFLILYFAFKDGDEVGVGRTLSSLKTSRNAFRHFVAQEQSALTSEITDRFWADYCGKLTPSRPPVLAATSSLPEPEDQVVRSLPPELVLRVLSVQKYLNVSAKSVFLASFLGMLDDWRRETKTVVAMVASGRSPDSVESLKGLGLYWNFVPIISEAVDPGWELLRKVHHTISEVERHSRFPLSQMLRQISPDDIISGSFNFIHFHNALWRRKNPRYSAGKTRSFHKFHFPVNLTVALDSTGEGASLSASWNHLNYDRGAISKMMDLYTAKLQELLENHSQRSAVKSR